MINGLTEEQFVKRMAALFTSSQPISTESHLHGREQNLREIKRALQSPGKHIFIYGDRGIGKTSLAKTAASANSDGGNTPIFVSCDKNVNFFNIIQSIIRNIFNNNRMFRSNFKIELAVGMMKIVKDMNIEEFPLISINDVMDAISYLTRDISGDTIIIIDEFDLLSDDKDREYFADFIKQLSDRKVKLRVIICGIGSSLETLIGVHLSTERYMSVIALKPISHSAMWKIIESAAWDLDVKVDREFLIRIGQISDGFPYYTHLMGEKIFWSAYEDQNEIKEISRDHYKGGIRQAIETAQTSLKMSYEKATQKYNKTNTDYEEVLWSVADGDPTARPSAEIYVKSYLRIMDQRSGRNSLARQNFNLRLNALKSDAHGGIVLGNRQGWYKFKENMVRGYVRLRAEDSSVSLGVDLAR